MSLIFFLFFVVNETTTYSFGFVRERIESYFIFEKKLGHSRVNVRGYDAVDVCADGWLKIVFCPYLKC